MSHSMINKIFSEFLNKNFRHYITIYTDGSVSPLSASYEFYISELHMSFTNNLPASSSSFSTECCAIIEALIFISNLAPYNYLIASDSISCLLALKSNPLNSHISPSCFALNKSPSYFIIQITQSNFCGSQAI
uniref:RNase H type-1 domain-containing protein n=1 Tax=Sipha flava TaxID=143950 RepID=A0A2S2QLU7_9HEMI